MNTFCGPGISEDERDILSAKTVLLVGAHYGARVARGLAALGLGKIVIYDGFPVSNGDHPQGSFTAADNDEARASVLGALIEQDGNTEVVDNSYDCFTGQRYGYHIYRLLEEEVDLILCMSDISWDHLYANQISVVLGVPSIHTLVEPSDHGGILITFLRWAKMPCLECLHPGLRREAEEAIRTDNRLTGCYLNHLNPVELLCLDSLVGTLALGCLLKGFDSRHGRLREALGPRQILSTSLLDCEDHSRRIRELLRLKPRRETCLGWNTGVASLAAFGVKACPICSPFTHFPEIVVSEKALES